MAQGIRDRIIMVIDAHPELSIRNVSLAAGLSDSALSKFLKGDTDDLKLETANRIADALGVDRVWLTHGVGDMDLASDIGAALGRVPIEQREQVLRIVETFIPRTGTDD